MSTVTDLRLSLLAAALVALFSTPLVRAQPTASHAAAPADMVSPVSAPADTASTLRAYDIPAQALGSSLARIASESGEAISVDAELVRGIDAPAVRGRYTAEQAAHAAMSGSGLELLRTGSGSWALRRPLAPAAGVVTLGAVQVTGERDPAVTENTGSYTSTGPSATGTPLALSLKETPQSVTVITRQRLDDQKLESVIDALESTTGVTAFRQGMGTDLSGLWSRGFTISNFLVDGIPSSLGSSSYWRNTAMYDRIEVVRGATGLMSGMGTPAASINLVRKRPTADWQASISAEAGSWDRYGLGADVSGPLSENGKLRGRLVVDEENQHSWIDRYEKQSRLVYGITELDLGSATLLTLGFSYETNNNDSPLRTGLPFAYSNGVPTHFKRSTNPAPDWSFYDSELSNVFASVKHDFGKGWNGKVEVTHTRYNYDSALYFLTGSIDQATGQGAALWPVRWKSNDKQTTLDAQISGPFDLLGRQHEVVAGLSLSQLRSDTPSYGGWLGPWTGYDGTIADFHHWDGASNQPSFVKAGDTQTKETQVSAYLTSRFKLADPTSLIAGARVINWERKADTSVVGVPGSTRADTRETGVIVPYAGLVHELNENWSVYGSYTRIFSPQSAATRDVNNNVLDPERGTSYELGVKSSFFDERLNAGLALFKTRQSNLANYDAATSSYVALQGITTKGAELELTGELSRGWNVAAGYTYSLSEDANGQRAIAQIPRHSVKLFTTYRLPDALNRLTVGGGVNWQSTSGYVGEAQQSSYAVVNAMARYEFSKQFSATLNVNNLFDKAYYSGLSAYGGVYGAPRNVMLSAKYAF